MKFLIAIIASIQVLAFQNCANNNFNKAVESGVLVEKSGDDDSAMTIPEDSEGEIPVTGGTTATGGTMGTGGTVATDCHPGNGKKSCTDTPPGNSGNPGAPGNPGVDDEGAGLYVCVVAGPGHSHKIGFVNNSLVGKVATPDDVCMSRKACTDIISQAFTVKMPAKRGFCPDKNPHVHHFTDAQIQAMINLMKK